MYRALYFIVPSKPPTNVRAVSQEPSTITVSWSSIPNDDLNGFLLVYKVFYRKAFYAGIYHVVSVEPPVLQVVIANLNSSDLYEVSVAGCTSAGCGVRSEPLFVMPGNGGSRVVNVIMLLFVDYKFTS